MCLSFPENGRLTRKSGTTIKNAIAWALPSGGFLKKISLSGNYG